MKNVSLTLRISLALVAGTSLVACAPFFESISSGQPAPRPHAVQTDLRPSIGYYENAVTAINDRHYALALEYLQAARTRRPDDVRVLTAFGVVYDKLARFDLSARYYAQAASLDPHSTIIAADMDYSRRLQGFTTAPQAIAAAAPDRSETGPQKVATALSQEHVADMSAPPVVVATADSSSEGSWKKTVALPQATPAVTATSPIARPQTAAAAPDRTDMPAAPSVRPQLNAIAAPDGSSEEKKTDAMPRATPAVMAAVPPTIGPQRIISAPDRMDIPVAPPIRPQLNAVDAPESSSEESWKKTDAMLQVTPAIMAAMPPTIRPQTIITAPDRSDISAPPAIPLQSISGTAPDTGSEGSWKKTAAMSLATTADIAVVSAVARPQTVVATPDSGGSLREVATAPPLESATNISAMSPPIRPHTLVAAAKMGNFPATKERLITSANAKTFFLTGHPLSIVDASGRSEGDKPVRAYLSGLGWSLPKSESAKTVAKSQTTIFYQETMLIAAKALARTLSIPMRLTANNDIQGVQLVLGSDISSGKNLKQASQPSHRQVAVAVARTQTRE